MVKARDHTRRNVGIFAGSAATFALLMLYPTSTNHRAGPDPAARQVVAAAALGKDPEAATVVVDGTPVVIKYGTVQVQIAVQSGHIVRATAINYPQEGGRDLEINGFAIPQLQRETVEEQSAQIDAITGATFTSKGYKESLQAALDAAHLG